MQTPKEFEEVAKSLQGLALAGESVPEMLKFVKKTLGSRPVAAAACFSIAFSADLADVSAVSGWTGFGHELADESVIAIVLPVVTKWLHDTHDTSAKLITASYCRQSEYAQPISLPEVQKADS